MGAYTPNSQVWYPDGTDTAEINTLLATVASSIENGIGARLEHQEIAVGAKLNAPLSYVIPSGSTFANATTVPYSNDGTLAAFNNGMSVSGGVVTIATTGMYIVTASLGGLNTAGRSVVNYLCKNGAYVASAEVPTNTSVYVSSQANCVLNLVPGDTISVKARSTGGTLTIAQNPELSYLTLAMVQAAPL